MRRQFLLLLLFFFTCNDLTAQISSTFAENGRNGFSEADRPVAVAPLSEPPKQSLRNRRNGPPSVFPPAEKAGGRLAECNVDRFLKLYRRASGECNVFDFVTTPGNEIIAGGYLYQAANPIDYTDALLIKFSASGVKIWEKNFPLPGGQLIEHITELADGNYLATGADQFEGNVSIFLLKFDTDGNILWKRTYQYTIGVSLRMTQLKEDTDGSLIATAYYIEDGLSFYDRVLFLKFTATGTLLLAKSYKPPGTINVTAPEDFIIQNGYTYIAGTYHSFTNYQGALFKVDNANGNLQWVRYYGFNNEDVLFTQIFPYGSNQLCLIGKNNLNATNKSLLFVCDTEGTVASATSMTYSFQREPGKAVLTKSGNLLWMGGNYSTAGTGGSLAIAQVHPVNGISSVKMYPQLTGYPVVRAVRFGTDSSLFFMGARSTALNEMAFFAGRMSADGNLSCNAVPEAYSFAAGNGAAATVPYTTTDKHFTEIQRNWAEGQPSVNLTDTLCYVPNLCNQVALNGPKRLCAGDTLRLKLQKSCTALPTLFFNTSQLQLINLTDSLVTFVTRAGGLAKVVARLLNDCGYLEDSVVVEVTAHQPPVDLGADRTLCSGNTLTLNAHKGYASYQWQDGSTDSTFTVRQPGFYFVKTTDACGGVFSDTVRVIASPPIPFDVGADRTKCNADTLHLQAPDGFLNYTWSNNYNISSTTGQGVVVNPQVDTLYYVKAEKTPGCFAYDTVRVKVNHSTPVDLGADRRFCQGDSVVFSAGAGFASYLWSGGQTGQSLTAKAAGTYAVTATTEEGCKSTATVKVAEVYTLPQPQLKKDPGLCVGETRTLTPGKFVTYQWSDGSAGETVTINSTGVYAVIVTDQHGCKGRDSVRITRMDPLPANFLPADTAICSYGSLELKPSADFRRYNWSTGGVAKAITISRPGLYWLEVTDNNGCRGRDSVKVNLKECMNGFYVPSAFTPNSDGKNDVFRPLLFGNVRQYRFTIFNRWGQMIFQTTERQNGWNGKIGAMEPESGVFVWTCTYQLEGEAVKQEKGTVTLLR